MKFRKKPVVVEAVQLTWQTWNEVREFVGEGVRGVRVDPKGAVHDLQDDKLGLLIPTPEGIVRADEGDWIVRGPDGELLPYKPAAFEATYETD